MRHGHCEGGKIFRGTTDVELSQQGWKQMQDNADLLHTNWQHIVTSPLQRCAVFSRYIAEQYSIPYNIEEDFHEIDFGGMGW